MGASILSSCTLLPEPAHTHEEALAYYRAWVSVKSDAFRRKAERIFESAAVEEKHTIAGGDVLFADRSLIEKGAFYERESIRLGTRLLESALAAASIRADQLDLLVTTSCTGYMIPALDAYLINALGLRENIRKLPITLIGCAAGVSGLIYASDYLKAYPHHHAAVLSFEFPSNTLQHHNYAWDNLVGTAIFGDGLGCAVLAGGAPAGRPCLIDTEMRQVANTTHILGYNLTDTGFLMNLDKSIPDVIAANFMNFVTPFLERNGLEIKDVDAFLVHPGGIKILDAIGELLAPYGKNVEHARRIMRRYGNMSSSTIHFILESWLTETHAPATALLLSFGPGFSAHLALLEWKHERSPANGTS